MWRQILTVALLAAPSAGAAGLREASAPMPPPLAASGGEVVLQLDITADGRVSGLRILQSAPPYDDALAAAAGEWRFDAEGTPARVLVAGVFTTFLGPAPDHRGIEDLGPKDLPFPLERRRPSYPPRALGSGTVVVEVDVSAAGAVNTARIVVSAPAFDDAALDAARAWRFRPASRAGRAVASTAVLVFGFREPVFVPARRR